MELQMFVLSCVNLYYDRLSDLLAQHMTNVYVLDFLLFSFPFNLPRSFAQSKQTKMK